MTGRTEPVEQQLQRRIFHLETLHEIGREIYPLKDIRAILKTAAMMICGTFGIPNVVVCLYRRQKLFSIVYLREFERQEIEEALTSPPEEMFEGDDDQRVRILSGAGDFEERLISCGMKVWLPLRISRDVSAGIGLGEMMIGDLLTDDLPFLATLCENTEIALKNAHMYQNLQRLNKKLKEEMQRDEAMHRITLLATTVFDRERLTEEGLKVILDWLGVASGKLCLPPDQHGHQLQVRQGVPDDPATSALLKRIEEEVWNSGSLKLWSAEGAKYVLCFTVGSRGQETGILLIMGDERLQRIYQEQMESLISMVDQMMLAIEHNRLMEDYFLQQYEKFRIRGLFEQYVAPEIVRSLVDEGKGVKLGGERRRVSIVMADISGSTVFAQREEPELVVEVLNRFFAEMTDAVYRNVGIVDKFIGDEIMATFGLFDLQQEVLEPDPVRAVMAGLEMRQRFEVMIKDFHKELKRDLEIGVHIGVATGEVVVGNVGSTKKIDYTVIGPPANLVARLANLATAGQLMIDEETYQAVEGIVEVEATEAMSLKGITKPVKVYRVLGEKK